MVSLTQQVVVRVANAWVSSRLDYCNSLFRGLSCCFNQHKLQSIQYSHARIVTNHRKFSSCYTYPKVTPLAAGQLPVCSKLQHRFINLYTVVLLAILDHPYLLAVVPTVPGVATLSIPDSSSF